jgi:hypothetical protein
MKELILLKSWNISINKLEQEIQLEIEEEED